MVKEWELKFVKECKKDVQNLKRAGLEDKIKALKDVLKTDPFKNPPPYEKLNTGQNRYSRRIDGKHRLVYEVLKKEHTVKIFRMWSHYGDN